jgi:hypothetical protein
MEHGAELGAQDILNALADDTALALTAWAEGRGDWREGHSSVEERIAIMVTVRNRRLEWRRWRAADNTYRAICLAPNQYSCWLPGPGANHQALMALAADVVARRTITDDIFLETLYLARGVIGGQILDRTGGAVSYYAPKAMVPAGRVPGWAAGKPTLQIGQQLFIVN